MLDAVAVGKGAARSVAEYLAKAAEFDQLAGSASEPPLQKRCADERYGCHDASHSYA
jgi:hypothetical protein